MLKVLLPVDGSPSAVRATQKLIETLGWYKEPPAIDLLAVHLPVPRVPNMGTFVSKDMLQQYYADECQAMFAPSRELLDAAGIAYTTHQAIGPIAESITEQATKLVRWTVMPRGGHFGPAEQPQAAVKELTTFFHALRDGA